MIVSIPAALSAFSLAAALATVSSSKKVRAIVVGVFRVHEEHVLVHEHAP